MIYFVICTFPIDNHGAKLNLFFNTYKIFKNKYSYIVKHLKLKNFK